MTINHKTWALAALLSLAGTVSAHDAQKAGDQVVPNFAQAIPNIPGKSLIAVEVNYPPGGQSLPHHHAHSAFIYAYVVSGSIRSQVEGHPARIYKAGESFAEEPGAHHLMGGNARTTEPAKLLAVFVVDSDDKNLTTPDK
ncbi:cupin domain-containing protein [Pseudomonas sp. SLFW]|uniref:cupin domain-containing protein n=1 Tax=Pseudomonas sp. SLFW TaxID=2683259 RepID=UPI001411CCCC|nr:cupin domain-containing protein [Pseudomonas sp. SLFW]NBB09835.1 cupin domain-containing protein [Pseudomonas sp. SLFW]